MTTDKEHLQWMLNRLAEVHGENRNVDYMTRMQKIIDSTKTELNLHLVSDTLQNCTTCCRGVFVNKKCNYCGADKLM